MRLHLAAFAIVGASCLSPTEFDVVIDTDIACSGPETMDDVDIAVGATGQATNDAPPAAVGHCTNGRIGDIVLVPATKNTEAMVRVVAGVGRVKTSECDPSMVKPATPDGGCVVARRIVRFVDHTSLTLPITLYARCIGVSCKLDETCGAGGACVSARTPCEGECTTPDGGTLLGPPSAVAAAAVPVIVTSLRGRVWGLTTARDSLRN